MFLVSGNPNSVSLGFEYRATTAEECVKIAILADPHAHLIGLQAVIAHMDAWQPDLVVVAGDIVNRGPRPRECLDLVLQRRARDHWQVIRGNHEGYVIGVVADPSSRPGVNGAIRESVRWTAQQIGDVQPILDLPTSLSLLGPDGSEVRVVHATMRHDRENMFVTTPEDEVHAMIAPAPPVFCCGHTHRPYVRMLETTLVINAGSTGLPFDRCRDVSYAQLVFNAGQWQAEIIRIPYDWEAALADIEAAGMYAVEPASALIIAAELRDARPYMARWVEQFDQHVIAGTMTALQSARRFLEEER